jgi:hypothetical protein
MYSMRPKSGFGIGIGNRNQGPMSVLDLNQNSGFGHITVGIP